MKDVAKVLVMLDLYRQIELDRYPNGGWRLWLFAFFNPFKFGKAYGMAKAFAIAAEVVRKHLENSNAG